MNRTPDIVPHKITKPIQLLAAWLAGLAIVNASFLTAAGLLHSPTWLAPLLTIASVVNVPLFIVSLFLLQTKFRPEMQEDTFYSQYLERKYAPITMKSEPVDVEKQLARVADDIVKKLSANAPDKQKQVVDILKNSEIEQLAESFANSRTLSELYLDYDGWPALHEMWREDDTFQHDILSLSHSGLVNIPDGVVANTTLTELGRAVAARLERDNRLWNQSHERHIPDGKSKSGPANQRLQPTRLPRRQPRG